jgi:hypothetical protein
MIKRNALLAAAVALNLFCPMAASAAGAGQDESVFAKSEDLRMWEILPEEYIHGRRYMAASHCLKYVTFLVNGRLSQ